MRFVTSNGQELKRQTWKCGVCKNDVVPNLVFVEGGAPAPFNIPIHCPSCLAYVGMFNECRELAEDADPAAAGDASSDPGNEVVGE